MFPVDHLSCQHELHSEIPVWTNGSACKYKRQKKGGNLLIFVPFFPWPFQFSQKRSPLSCVISTTMQTILFPSCSSRFELLIGLSAQLVTAPPKPLQKRKGGELKERLISSLHFILPTTLDHSLESTEPTPSHALSATLCCLQ